MTRASKFLNLSYLGIVISEGIYPAEALVLYEPGAVFDKNYNSHFTPYKFILPQDTIKVSLNRGCNVIGVSGQLLAHLC